MPPFGVKLGAVFPQPMSEVCMKFGGAKPHGTVLEDCRVEEAKSSGVSGA